MASIRSFGPWKALSLALAFAAVLAWSQRTVGPSRDELVLALDRVSDNTVASADVSSVICKHDAVKSGYDCRWQQMTDTGWRERTGHLIADAQGWRFSPAPEQ